MDVALLTEVNALNPFRTPAKWAEVEMGANAAISCIREGNEDISERAMQDRVDLLMKHFVRQNNKMLKKYVELDTHLLCIDCNQLFVCLGGGEGSTEFVSCRSGTTEDYTNKMKLLDTTCQLKRDADACAKALKEAKKKECQAKKCTGDLRLQVMRVSKAGDRSNGHMCEMMMSTILTAYIGFSDTKNGAGYVARGSG